MSLTNDILSLHAIHLSLFSEWNNIANDFSGLSANLIAEGNPTSGATCLLINAKLQTIRNLYMGATPSMRNTTYDILHYIDENLNGVAVVDMDSILTSMITADFDQLQKFIGIVDAYRVALWNAPFNADFYAALARGFQKWP